MSHRQWIFEFYMGSVIFIRSILECALIVYETLSDIRIHNLMRDDRFVCFYFHKGHLLDHNHFRFDDVAVVR